MGRERKKKGTSGQAREEGPKTLRYITESVSRRTHSVAQARIPSKSTKLFGWVLQRRPVSGQFGDEASCGEWERALNWGRGPGGGTLFNPSSQGSLSSLA